jgi:hypothetical protein
VPIGFCCGGFSSTAGYVPGNEACNTFVSQATFALLLAVPFQKLLFVFIRTIRKSFSTSSEQSLSASIQGVNSNYFPSFAALESARHRSARLSLIRSKARKHF